MRLYGRDGLLFLLLAGIVVVPYEVVVVLLESGKHGAGLGTELILVLVDLALIGPGVAAFQVHAILSLGSGERPRIPDVLRRGVVALPVVAAAEIIAGLGEALGLLCFLIPGLIAAVRWAVVAQAAAVERVNWPTAITRSTALTRGNFWRVLGVLLIAAVLNDLVSGIIGAGSGAGAIAVGIALAILVHSFGTLLTSLLYFDLRARENLA
jgi:hypothetical protein